MCTTIPVIPDVIAGITHEQVMAYFKELSAIAGFPIGHLAKVYPNQSFNSFEMIAGEVICVCSDSPMDLVTRHLAQRPLTGMALAQKKLAEAQALVAQEQQKSAAQR